MFEKPASFKKIGRSRFQHTKIQETARELRLSPRGPNCRLTEKRGAAVGGMVTKIVPNKKKKVGRSGKR